MLDHGHALEVAARYRVGEQPVLAGPVAHGEQGDVWRLDTSLGRWAVKELFTPTAEADVVTGADYQDAVHAAGVPVPAVVRTVDRCVLCDLGAVQATSSGGGGLIGPGRCTRPTSSPAAQAASTAPAASRW